ncbi:Leucine rich repeat protein [Spraguea lophii 42_110]|uniref:Leucine rich repeat protein n=1 Tax=Spraguea lophii (strain 42_110) TaxID=1358809 RepID=S7XVI5_SPRLO|nr:Leucine rich repeat protein [Spraguea lophii 42_110]
MLLIQLFIAISLSTNILIENFICTYKSNNLTEDQENRLFNFVSNLYIHGDIKLNISKVIINCKSYLPSEIKCIGYLGKIKKLSLRNSCLYKLPSTFKNLVDLEELSLSNNYFFELPEEIYCLKSLRVLDISDNYISVNSMNLDCLENLETVNISHNFYENIEESEVFNRNEIFFRISNMKNMKKLIFSKISLNILPEHINLFYIKYMDLSYNNISSIPNDLLCLINLGHLDLSYNNFTIFPYILGSLGNLVYLNISGNLLKDVKFEPGLFCSLKTLVLDSCGITNFYVCKNSLSNLSSLNISNKNLRNLFAQSFSPRFLKQIKMDYNVLDTFYIEDNWFYMNHVFIDVQTLDCIVSGLGKFENLIELNITLKENQKLYKDNFNFVMENLNLVKFTLKGSNMEEIPMQILFLKDLEFLDLSHNNIKKIRNDICPLQNLIYIDLSYNYIQLIPKVLLYMRNLRQLNLMCNKIKFLPKSLNGINLFLEINLEKNNISMIFDKNFLGIINISYKIAKNIKISPRGFHNIKGLAISDIYNLAKKSKYSWNLRKIKESKIYPLKKYKCYNDIVQKFAIFSSVIKNPDLFSKVNKIIEILCSKDIAIIQNDNYKISCIFKTLTRIYIYNILFVLEKVIIVDDKILGKTFNQLIEIFELSDQDAIMELSALYNNLLLLYEDFSTTERFLEHQIAFLKEFHLKEITSHDKFPRKLFKHWRSKLKEELGIYSNDSYYKSDSFLLNNREYILFQFFSVFSTERVINYIKNNITRNKKMFSMIINEIIQDRGDEMKNYFFYRETTNIEIYGINEKGAEYLLKKYNFIV